MALCRFSVPLSRTGLPEPFLDPFVRERCHGKARVGNAEAAFFVGQHDRSSLDGVALSLGAGERPRSFQAVLQD